MPDTTYVADEEHYSLVVERMQKVKEQPWIGTADIKDLYVKDGRSRRKGKQRQHVRQSRYYRLFLRTDGTSVQHE